ncbi:hypothetical protein COZ60_00175, partial [Candidatus Bathyarchaeota archaeon CG_4_8_14_3_um_filter_42_8]
KRHSLEQIIEVYSITGGMPYYLVGLDLKKTATDNILEHIAKKGRPLLEEGEVLIREELPDATTYFSILHAISNGETKQSEIANHIGMPATTITRYLTNLQRLNFIKKEVPVTEGKRSKKSIYSISDNFIRFWFRFIYPNRSYIEEENSTRIREILKKGFILHVSRVFEEVCTQALCMEESIGHSSIGRWWGSYRDMKTNERKTAEIDIVVLNEEKNEIVYAECKWKEEVDVDDVLKKLKEKTVLVDWKTDKRKERFVIFAKSFKRKTEYSGVRLYDLNDLKNIFSRSQSN